MNRRERGPSLGAVLALAGAALLMVVLLGGVLFWMSLEAEPEPVRELTPETSEPAVTPARVSPRGDLTESERRTIDIFREASPAVVYITKIAVREDPLRRNLFAIPQGTGSGFVWDREGHVVTNYHVVRGGHGARVTLADQSAWPASLVGRYAEKDLAVLRIQAPPEKLHPIRLGTSRDLLVGQHVYAIGNPFGLDHTLSTGVVSGLGREIPSLGGRPIQGAIQTDAAINPGNSGGPLLDSAGRLIGVNTQIYSPTGTSTGVGFAVPVDSVARVVPQLIQHGRVVRPGLGIQIDRGELARRAGVRGVLVLGVLPGSGAERAGLQPTRLDPRTGTVVIGDVIVAVGGEEVEDPGDLYRLLDEKEVGQTVPVTIRRSGRSMEVQVTLMPLLDD